MRRPLIKKKVRKDIKVFPIKCRLFSYSKPKIGICEGWVAGKKEEDSVRTVANLGQPTKLC